MPKKAWETLYTAPGRGFVIIDQPLRIQSAWPGPVGNKFLHKCRFQSFSTASARMRRYLIFRLPECSVRAECNDIPRIIWPSIRQPPDVVRFKINAIFNQGCLSSAAQYHKCRQLAELDIKRKNNFIVIIFNSIFLVDCLLYAQRD